VQLSVSRTMTNNMFLSRISGKTNIFHTVIVISFYVINFIQNFLLWGYKFSGMITFVSSAEVPVGIERTCGKCEPVIRKEVFSI
jgi:hypothetical protein